MDICQNLYAAGLKRSQRRAVLRRRSLPAYVISIGNLSSGGTGKTPLTLWLAERLAGLGLQPAILSRGYGRDGRETVLVPREGEPAPQIPLFGDEPVLMARKVPTVPVWVGPVRWLSGKAAIRSSGARVLLLDDGFQHLSLKRDLDLVLLDAANPFGNGMLHPFGPLREPPEHLGRADAIVLTRADDLSATAATRSQLARMFPQKPLFTCRHRISVFRTGLGGHEAPLALLTPHPAVAFAGIARSHPFFQSLETAGIKLARTLPFSDHHLYTAQDMQMLLESVRETGARFLITTEKDAVRLPSRFASCIVTAVPEVDFGSESEAFSNYISSGLAPLLLSA